MVTSSSTVAIGSWRLEPSVWFVLRSVCIELEPVEAVGATMNGDRMTPDRIAAAGNALASAKTVFVVTGAGISAESGIPTFRGAGGLWEGFRAEELATPAAFEASPERVWRWYLWRREQYHACPPNVGHWALRSLSLSGRQCLIATQNVDGLHRHVGHGDDELVELHGCIEKMHCTRCGRRASLPPVASSPPGELPTCGECGGLMRPHVLWFGESYWDGVLERAAAFAQHADVCLVVGTSAQVWPPIQLALFAQQQGATLIDINPEPTELSNRADIYLRARGGEALSALLEAAGVPLSMPEPEAAG